MLTEKQIEQLLLENQIFTEEEIKKSQANALAQNKPWKEYLHKEKTISEETLFDLYAKSLKVPFINLENVTIRKDILNLIPETIAETHKILAFDQTEKEIKIAALDPGDLEIFDFIERDLGEAGFSKIH